jgi:hypothetical protein
MHRTALLLLALASASGHAADRCDWRSQLLVEDQAAPALTPKTALGLIADRYDDADQQAGAAQARNLLQRAVDAPQPVGDIAGRWKIRSIQVSTGQMQFAYAYPSFAATIKADGCGFRFSKDTGSQRHGGVLYRVAGHADELAFLGTAVVNDQTLRDYGPDNLSSAARGDGEHASNSTGKLWRIAPDTVLLLVDTDGGGFNLYQLTR